MRLLKTATFLLATALMVMGMSRTASADVTVLAATSGGNYGNLDMTTGVYTNTGATGVPAIVGMGWINGTLYGADDNSSGAGFYSINPANGALTTISSNLGITAIGGTTGFGNFYGATQDSMALVFGSSTSGFVFGSIPLGFQSDGLVAFDSGFHYLYLSAFTNDANGTGDELYRINTTSLAIQDVGALNALSFTGIISGNTLYSTDGSNIYTYALGNGTVSGPLTQMAITGGPIDNGDQIYAVAATPEPGSMTIVGLVFVAAGFVHARRRFRVA